MQYLAFLAAVMLAGCAVSPHKATHRLQFDDGICSGTAVGSHTLLSAQHCFTGRHALFIDGVPAAVLYIVPDGADHVLVIVSATFADFAQVGAAPVQAQHVHYWGNPAGLFDIYREGYVSGYAVADGRNFLLIDTNAFYGDSGAGVFNAGGQVIGVISMIYQNTTGGYLKFMCMYPLRFTAKQWAEVR